MLEKGCLLLNFTWRFFFCKWWRTLISGISGSSRLWNAVYLCDQEICEDGGDQ